MDDQTNDRSPCRTCGRPITIEPRINDTPEPDGYPATIGVRVCLNPKCPNGVTA